MMTNPFLASDERLDEVNENLRLIQKKQGLTFGTDAYLLAAFVRPFPRAFAVEIGGGTGIVSLLLAQTNKVRAVCSVEIQPDYADLIGRNAAMNGLSDRVTPLCADVRDLGPGDLSEAPALVVANPPYLRVGAGRTNAAREKELARHETAGGIGDFCACAARLLGTGGRFFSVYRPERLADLYAALRANRLEPKRTVFVHADRLSPPCAVLTEAVKDASASLRVLPPLFLYEPRTDPRAARRMTPETERVYNTCSFSGQEGLSEK